MSNTDDRRLERAAETGDEEAQRQLHRELALRLGRDRVAVVYDGFE